MRGTGEFSVDFRPKNHRELFTLLKPNGSAPLNAFLAMGQTEATDDPACKNFRDELPGRVLQINNGAGYNGSATALTIYAGDENPHATAGAIVLHSRTGEVIHVAADTTLTVTRTIGGTAHAV